MHKIGRWSGIGAAVLAGALILGACGGDDGGSSADTTAPAAGEDAATTAAGEDAATTAAGGGGADTTIDTNFSGEGSDEFCSKLKELEDSPVLNGDPDFTNPDALKEQYAAIEDAIGELADRAPDEIQADVETMQSGLGDLIKLFEEYDYDFQKIVTESQSNPDLAARLESVSSGEMDAASQRLEAYGQQVCGLTSDTTTG